MTPDQAATLIRAAWNAPENDHDSFAFSDRIALALDAIGLLDFASDPRYRSRRILDEQLNQPVPVDWATLRDRKAREQSLADQFPNETLATIHHRAKGE